MIKIYMLLLVLGLIGGVGYGAYYYYKDTQARIAILTENSAKLEQAANTQRPVSYTHLTLPTKA